MLIKDLDKFVEDNKESDDKRTSSVDINEIMLRSAQCGLFISPSFGFGTLTDKIMRKINNDSKNKNLEKD